MEKIIRRIFDDSIAVKRNVVKNLVSEIEISARIMIDVLKQGNKLLICGNGGSAADSQHFAAELVMRFEKNRPALPAIALTTDSSNITACGNDFGYDVVFERQVEGLGREGDVLIAITTSGNSNNLVRALEIAKRKGMKTICLNGKSGGKMNDLDLDSNLIVEGNNTARIQESHITIIHTWCKLIEDTIFED